MTKSGWIIVALAASVALLVAALMFMLGRATAPEEVAVANQSTAKHVLPALPTAAKADDQGPQDVSNSSEANSSPDSSRTSEGPAVGPAFTERFSDLALSLRFVPTARFRRLIEYRGEPVSRAEDSSCSDPYSARERVTRISFAWGFVIERFWTWNSAEGQQEYVVDETALPRAWQGSLHDLVREGRMLTITKQRCGQGQVAGLVSIRP